jgi:N-acetylglucosamine-6-phosphate deacetylase
MNKFKKGQIIKNISSNWFSLGINVVTGIIVSPFIVHRLGDTANGIWVLIFSVTGYYGLFDLGIRSSVVRYVSKFTATNDDEELAKVVNTSLFGYSCIGLLTVLLTLAPERSNAIAAIALAVSLGMRLSLGHTNAPHKRLLQAVAAGATGFTHLGNGCPRELDRFDNILWRVLETPGLQVSLIPDGIHVSPALFRLIHRTLGSESIYYTTDAMSAAGAPPGRYKIGRLELEVGEDKTVRLPGKPNLAGSALKPIEGIFCAAEMLGSAWQDAWVRFSEAPARFMKLNFGLKVGAPADFCLVEVVPQNQLENLHVLVEGGNT